MVRISDSRIFNEPQLEEEDMSSNGEEIFSYIMEISKASVTLYIANLHRLKCNIKAQGLAHSNLSFLSQRRSLISFTDMKGSGAARSCTHSGLLLRVWDVYKFRHPKFQFILFTLGLIHQPRICKKLFLTCE